MSQLQNKDAKCFNRSISSDSDLLKLQIVIHSQEVVALIFRGFVRGCCLVVEVDVAELFKNICLPWSIF